MTDKRSCEDISELAAELALGVATGEDRAAALEHLAACPRCRNLVASLSEVADDLLLIAPAREPPVGFEARVLQTMSGQRRTTGRWRVALAAVAIVIAGLAGAGGVYVASDEDRELASAYRETLRVADGRYFKASPLRPRHGGSVGYVFAYRGSPSWLMIILDAGVQPDTYDIAAVTRQGKRTDLGSMTKDEGVTASWGRAVPIDLKHLAALHLVGRQRGQSLTALNGH